MKKILTILLVLTFAISFAACGAARNEAPDYESYNENPATAAASMAPQAAGEAGFGLDQKSTLFALTDEAEDMAVEEDIAMDEAPPDVPDGGIAGPSVPQVVDSTRKIIKNMDLQLQTVSFDKGVEEINNLVNSTGGYIQDSYVQGTDMYADRGRRYASFTARIPQEKLDAFVSTLGGMFNVISKNQNSQDITESYFDSKARLDSLTVQEQRLLAMLENATELEYMLQVERELMNVRYEIESLTSSLKRMDNYVSLSTVTISLQEVIKYEPVENVPVTFGQRVARAFHDSWVGFAHGMQSFFVFLVAALPTLLVLALIAVVLVVFIRRSNKKRAGRKAQQPPVQTPPLQYAPAIYPANPPANPNPPSDPNRAD